LSGSFNIEEITIIQMNAEPGKARSRDVDGRAPLLAVERVSKTFGGSIALDSVSIDLQSGEVHAIVGENGAGKSTLLNIVSGAVTPDTGEIRVRGEVAHFTSPKDAHENGVGTVFQELSLVPNLSVSENIFSNRAPVRNGVFIRWSTLHQQAEQLMAQFGQKINVKVPVERLPSSTRQVVEIAKALSLNAQIILLDEPTSALTADEVDALFAVIRRLKANGIGIMYISHRMREVFGIADRITVLRDGRKIGTFAKERTSTREIVRLMVGRELDAMFEPRRGPIREIVLQGEGLNQPGLFSDVNLAVRAGEIVGLAGLMGSRCSELGMALAGVVPTISGVIRVKGRTVRMRGISDAIKLGIAYLPAERKTDGLFLEYSIGDNIISAILPRFSKYGFIDRAKRDRVANRYLSRLNVRAFGVHQLVEHLSGGNQQKVLVAKWLITEPSILIVDEPTKGIDVGAKYEIHALLRGLADGGAGILVISSDTPELLHLCDRIIVMRKGRIGGEFAAQAVTEDAIIRCAIQLDSEAADEKGNQHESGQFPC
jgi:ribose transport system ATP-binding protein